MAEGGFLGERRRLVQRAEVVRVLPHVAEHPRRRIGILERGNVRVGEDAPSRGHLGATHPARQYRFARVAVRVGLEPFRRQRRRGLILGSEDRQDPVALFVRSGRLHRLRVGFRVGVPKEVNGCSRGRLAAGRDQRVRGQHSGSPRIGKDAQPPAFRARLLGESVCHVEEVRDRVDPQHAGAAESGGERFVASGQSARVRSRGLRRLCGASTFEDDDRLA